MSTAARAALEARAEDVDHSTSGCQVRQHGVGSQTRELLDAVAARCNQQAMRTSRLPRTRSREACPRSPRSPRARGEHRGGTPGARALSVPGPCGPHGRCRRRPHSMSTHFSRPNAASLTTALGAMLPVSTEEWKRSS